MWLSVSIVIVYSGFYLFIVFLSLSIACGLYYLAEMIEEYTITTKRLIGYTIKAEFLLHLLLLIDRLPFYCILLGLASHVAYLRLLKRFPYMQFVSLDGLFALVTFAGSTVAWVGHFWKSYYTVEYIVAFLLVTTYLVPTAFFLSAAGDQAVLPGAGGYPYSGQPQFSSPMQQPRSSSRHQGDGKQKKRRSLALGLFDLLKRKRDEVMPDMLAKLPAGTGLLKEKV